jgi:hypothetical protein
LKNVRGDGYTLLPPKDQVAFAYKETLSVIKKAIKDGKSIMNNIRLDEIPHDQLAADSEKINKLSLWAQAFATKRN